MGLSFITAASPQYPQLLQVLNGLKQEGVIGGLPVNPIYTEIVRRNFVSPQTLQPLFRPKEATKELEEPLRAEFFELLERLRVEPDRAETLEKLMKNYHRYRAHNLWSQCLDSAPIREWRFSSETLQAVQNMMARKITQASSKSWGILLRNLMRLDDQKREIFEALLHSKGKARKKISALNALLMIPEQEQPKMLEAIREQIPLWVKVSRSAKNGKTVGKQLKEFIHDNLALAILIDKTRIDKNVPRKWEKNEALIKALKEAGLLRLFASAASFMFDKISKKPFQNEEALRKFPDLVSVLWEKNDLSDIAQGLQRMIEAEKDPDLQVLLKAYLNALKNVAQELNPYGYRHSDDWIAGESGVHYSILSQFHREIESRLSARKIPIFTDPERVLGDLLDDLSGAKIVKGKIFYNKRYKELVKKGYCRVFLKAWAREYRKEHEVSEEVTKERLFKEVNERIITYVLPLTREQREEPLPLVLRELIHKIGNNAAQIEDLDSILKIFDRDLQSIANTYGPLFLAIREDLQNLRNILLGKAKIPRRSEATEISGRPEVLARSGSIPKDECQTLERLYTDSTNGEGQPLNRIKHGQFKVANYLADNRVVARRYLEIARDEKGNVYLLVAGLKTNGAFVSNRFDQDIVEYARSIRIPRERVAFQGESLNLPVPLTLVSRETGDWIVRG